MIWVIDYSLRESSTATSSFRVASAVECPHFQHFALFSRPLVRRPSPAESLNRGALTGQRNQYL